MPLGSKDIMQALAGFTSTAGVAPLKAGHIQNIAVEPHGAQYVVSIHVDEQWELQNITDQDRDELVEFVRRQFLDVDTVRVIPRTRERMREARRFAHRDQGAPKVPTDTRMIAVISGKGGVGKSTVSVNLAVALSHLGLRSAILDCDIYGFSVPGLLGVTESARTQDGKFIPPLAYGIQVMSMRFFVGHNAPVMWRGPLLNKALRQLMGDTLWNQPQYMVLDLPPGTGDMALDVHQLFPQAAALLVTTPDVQASIVAERAGQMAVNLKRQLIGVVENMAFMVCPECQRHSYPLGQGGADRVAANLKIPVLARIPWVMDGARGLTGIAPVGSAAESAYRHLAQNLTTLNIQPSEATPSTPFILS
jgi:ATP-binding protein involved in chromosome partitioning